MIRLGLAGQHIGYSLSPVIHQAALGALGLAGDYRLFDVPAEGLAPLVDALGRGELTGLNVTVPHKALAARLADRLEGDAALLGVANTLAHAEDGAIRGHNTDPGGLEDALRAGWPDLPWRGGLAVVLGAGGAARAAVLAAVRTGAGRVRVVNRTPARARTLAETLGPRLPAPLEAFEATGAALEGAALVLQATPAGTGSRPGEPGWTALRDAARPLLARSRPGAVLMDLVYRPELTPWTAAARAEGFEAASGLPMLVRQAARSLTLWTGHEAPVDVMRRAASEALEGLA